MKRLLVVHPFAGSPDRQRLWETIRVRSGWDLTILTASKWRNDYGLDVPCLQSQEFQGKLEPVPVVLSGNIPLHFYASNLARVIRGHRPDFVYVYHEPYGVATFETFLANRLAGEAPIGFSSSQNIYKRYPPPFRWAERHVLRTASLGIAVSQTVADVLRSKGCAAPIVIVPFGIDTDIYRPAPSRQLTSRGLHVGFVGRLVREKGVDTILRAIKGIASRGLHLTVVGDGPDLERLNAIAVEYDVQDRVSWAGYQPPAAVPGFLNAFDVLVVPSKTTHRWREQFGRVVIESLACGTPVIVSNSGELPHLIAQTRGGWSFPEDDAIALAQILLYLMDAPNELTLASEEGLAEVTNRFTTEVVADKFIQAVSSILV